MVDYFTEKDRAKFRCHIQKKLVPQKNDAKMPKKALLIEFQQNKGDFEIGYENIWYIFLEMIIVLMFTGKRQNVLNFKQL